MLEKLNDYDASGTEHSLTSLSRSRFAGGYAVPFDTQLLNLAEDDDDLPYFNEDELDDTSPAGASASLDQGEDDLLQSATQLKRVRPENINYAKRAKRVDVKKLKDSIWKELEEVTIAVKEVRLLSLSSSRAFNS